MDIEKITFKNCIELFDLLEQNMGELELITISAKNESITSFLRNDSGLKREIVYVDGELKENYEDIDNSIIDYLRVYREKSFGVFGTKVIEDFELALQNGQYIAKINVTCNQKNSSLPIFSKY